MKRAAPRVLGGSVDQRINDIAESHVYQTGKPCLIKREHLLRKSYWPNWVFSIVMLFGPGKVAQEVRGKKKDKRWILKVDLLNESYGIYNNCGKRFLEERFRRVATSPEILRRSEEFHRFMQPSRPSGDTWVWGDVGETVPLRWASGGFLPIVSYNGKFWALLFFRDISPVGLNVANGASEDKAT